MDLKFKSRIEHHEMSPWEIVCTLTVTPPALPPAENLAQSHCVVCGISMIGLSPFMTNASIPSRCDEHPQQVSNPLATILDAKPAKSIKPKKPKNRRRTPRLTPEERRELYRKDGRKKWPAEAGILKGPDRSEYDYQGCLDRYR